MEPKKTIVLIGGAPTTGKSTMAEKIARHLNLPWISTDQIRDIARYFARREDVPNLFNPEGYDAEKFLTKFSAQEISDIEFKQGDAVWPAVRAFIEKDYTYERGFVIEGVNLLPHHITDLQGYVHTESLFPVFLIDDNEERIRDVIFNRGLWGDADSYPDSVKEKEVEWVRVFNNRIRDEAAEHNISVVDVSKQDNDVAKVLEVLGLA